ncbi:MAG: ABC transporter permease [Flavisolibacter sp.]|nr:ABC transporter permease [Flavisolibacter sp.]
MIRNYLKIAFRYLAKYKGYTFINVLGLAVGITCCILIMLFVKSEWSFDRFHPKADRIYRAWLEEHYQGEIFRNTVTPIPLVPVLQAGLPEVEASCRIAELRPPLKINNNTFNDPVTMVDSSFFRMFDFKLIEGTTTDPFPTANSIILTKEAAKKYFGKESAIGKSLELQLGEDRLLFTVTALAKDPPLESTIQFDVLIPLSNAKYIWSEKTRTSAWSNVSVGSFFLLKKDASIKAVHSKIASIMNPLVTKNYKPGEYLVRLQPLKDIHFNATLPEGLPRDSDPKYSYILATIGILILLIACINFVTLSIGRSTTRALEVGVRKVLGAERQQLIRQFWGEALLLTLFALIIGIVLAIVLLRPFNQIANRELVFVADGFTILFCLLLIVLIALVAGMYPAFVLSGFKPIQVLKGKLNVGSNMGFFRKALIVGQFVASIVMIIGTITVGKQLDYLRNKSLGYNKEHILIVPTNNRRAEGLQVARRFETVVQKNSQVVGTTTSLYSMAESGWMQLGYNDNQNVFRQFRFNAVDADFVTTMGLQMIAGRNFLKDNPADSNVILVNEALVKEYGWKDPIGQKLPGKYTQQVIGVVKDFHFESLHTPIKPAVMALKPDSIFANSSDVTFEFSPQPRVSVRSRGGNLQNHVDFLRSAWRSVAGDQDFEYQFLDDALSRAYQQEQRLSKIVSYASFLSIFIACLGLFGLATLVVVRRTKEIGIRKVLGAEVSSIVALLSKDFVVLVVVASFIAFPIAWWALHQWLQDFAYRISIPWWVFIASAIVAFVIALGTVSIQAIKAALANPVKSLRTE